MAKESAEQIEEYRRLMKVEGQKRAFAVAGLYEQGLAYEEIGKLLGVTRMQAWRLHDQLEVVQS